MCAHDVPCKYVEFNLLCGSRQTADSLPATFTEPCVAAVATPLLRSKYTHPACSQGCGRGLLCGHACREPCHGGTPCPPCGQPCKTACHHGECKGRCMEPCKPCVEPCAWHCPHQVLSLACSHVQQSPASTSFRISPWTCPNLLCLMYAACKGMQAQCSVSRTMTDKLNSRLKSQGVDHCSG